MARRKRRNKKPRGEIGYLRVGSDVEFHTVPLPETKAEIEQWILDHALASAGLNDGRDPYQLLYRPVQNNEDDFDFSLPTAHGPQFLDLMEIVILPKGARGYEDGRPAYDAEAMAAAVFYQIKQKSDYYGSPRTPTHLLLYATDWRFRLVEPVTWRLALLLNLRNHVFATVSYFAPNDDHSGEFLRLYPIPKEIMTGYERQYLSARRKNQRQLVMIGNPRQAELHGPGVVMFPNPLAPKK